MIGSLILENGMIFNGHLFGNTNICVTGDIVFQTGMVGYVEALTDPSYEEQLLVFTYPIMGNYGVPIEKINFNGYSENFESKRIHPQAIIVQEIVNKYSHWEADISLSEWLKKKNVIGISGIDTRALTKVIREHGTMKAKIIKGNKINSMEINYESKNLVSKVSKKRTSKYLVGANNYHNKYKILVIDCGMKNNQINIILNKAYKINESLSIKDQINVHIVPYNYNFDLESVIGIFISNGPGDPRDDCLKDLVDRLKIILQFGDISVFGICLGHQIISLAKGYKITKMKYGNRGHNIPVRLSGTNRGFITSQNHGYTVTDPENISDMYFYNLNDNTNEGIIDDSSFSVQFHPEARAGPNDTEFLFDIFFQRCFNQSLSYKNLIKNYISNNNTVPYYIQPNSIKKILLLGSGGLSIGQAGEFDYSGTQAIKSFKEEGIEVVLINPNIATIQTSKGLADKIYYLPVTSEYVKQIIEKEKPDCIALSFGGQTALNCGVELYEAGIIGKDIKILGTPVEAIQMTEDRDKFRKILAEINEECAPSDIAYNLPDAIKIAETIGYPVLIRAAFALGGLGSGFARNKEELMNLVETALCHSNQIIIDKSLIGWKEVEYVIV